MSRHWLGTGSRNPSAWKGRICYKYRYSHYKDKTVSRPSYLYNGNPIPSKTVFMLRQGPGDSWEYTSCILHADFFFRTHKYVLVIAFDNHPTYGLQKQITDHIMCPDWPLQTQEPLDNVEMFAKGYEDYLQCPLQVSSYWKKILHQTSNISCAFVGNKIVDHSDVVGASPVGAAPTTSSFSA